MIILLRRSKASYDSESGRMKKGDTIVHFGSDLNEPDKQREELTRFVSHFDLPIYMMENKHFTDDPPRLDAWGTTAKEALAAFDKYQKDHDVIFKSARDSKPQEAPPKPKEEPRSAAVYDSPITPAELAGRNGAKFLLFMVPMLDIDNRRDFLRGIKKEIDRAVQDGFGESLKDNH